MRALLESLLFTVLITAVVGTVISSLVVAFSIFGGGAVVAGVAFLSVWGFVYAALTDIRK